MYRTSITLQRLQLPSIVSKQRSHLTCRSYSRSCVKLDEAETVPEASNGKIEMTPEFKRMAARDYFNRRLEYNRQVTRLRKEYAEEVARQKAVDKAEAEALYQLVTRRRLERQRKKNIRTAQNEIKHKLLREQRNREFAEHLRIQQMLRDKKHDRYTKAREMVIDELEEEAPLWLTTVEEVESAFTHEAEQLLWSFPGGVLGAPNPSIDSHFWEYETHTWHMTKTYKSMRTILLKKIEDRIYKETNIDSKFWTPERLDERKELTDRARLRAMVHSKGRSELLRKQFEMLNEDYNTEEGPPKLEPSPGLRYLDDSKALETEGAKILLRDPTKFFVFDSVRGSRDSNEKDEMREYKGPVLGAPIALRDHLREKSHQGSVLPYGVGKPPKPDTRTEREKKQQEREEKMLAAAAAEASENDVELAATDMTLQELQSTLNYDEFDLDAGDEEWLSGLDKDEDRDIWNTPAEMRYTEKDIAWVLNKLKKKQSLLEYQHGVELDTLKQRLKSKSKMKSTETVDQPNEELELIALQKILYALPNDQLFALSELDEAYSDSMSEEELSNHHLNIPGLTREQLLVLMNRDRSS